MALSFATIATAAHGTVFDGDVERAHRAVSLSRLHRNGFHFRVAQRIHGDRKMGHHHVAKRVDLERLADHERLVGEHRCDAPFRVPRAAEVHLVARDDHGRVIDGDDGRLGLGRWRGCRDGRNDRSFCSRGIRRSRWFLVATQADDDEGHQQT
jgi:hypothetical protein